MSNTNWLVSQQFTFCKNLVTSEGLGSCGVDDVRRTLGTRRLEKGLFKVARRSPDQANAISNTQRIRGTIYVGLQGSSGALKRIQNMPAHCDVIKEGEERKNAESSNYRLTY